MEHIFLELRSPGPDLFQLGPFSLRWYGLLIAISVLVGLNLSSELASKKGLKKSLINDLLPILVLASVIGARIYYVAFEWRNYTGKNFWSSINFLNLNIPLPSALEIWGGGIAIHGALIMGTLSIIFFCRWRKEPFWDVIDVLVPSVALGQAIGRWGNFFNNEAFGIPTNLPWKLFIPYRFRPEIFSTQDYFHPTFLYESVWNIFVFGILIFLFRKSNKKELKLPPGSLSCLYLITYSLGRFWIEGLRTDPLCLGGVPPFCEGGLRIAQLISLFLISAGLLGIWRIYVSKKALPDPSSINGRNQ
ncbi:putative prolipoprotein diacylglyceryl transferase [Prochlorococcus marinus str. NATL1A]|uniref:Phosphatidylglycerol--prolipoprotein diacylglyceryl transferase n=1 Tax=Prochlorococcus marinus (strain NATL1A) TaxID=167555 RepID=LGT_PROM1|nr:prolipoprotein diacylglyceryl transferase [Prochlorococcus marinus]A2C0R7.1 RecName: Full=Phosphatidylglycerol--prolipoprotein diacylglyceryl transferase [Prochlorococcus marinus str. NATL1A]ABM75077.1 putative prolipoprotein diacylglyceryl transferase [Prochlorococcus marinus str. NATL1A]